MGQLDTFLFECIVCLAIIHVTSCTLFSVQTERDNSVRQKAIDLLYAMCDVTNSETIVAELLSYLGHAEYSVREALVSSTEFVCITLSRVTEIKIEKITL